MSKILTVYAQKLIPFQSQSFHLDANLNGQPALPTVLGVPMIGGGSSFTFPAKVEPSTVGVGGIFTGPGVVNGVVPIQGKATIFGDNVWLGFDALSGFSYTGPSTNRMVIDVSAIVPSILPLASAQFNSVVPIGINGVYTEQQVYIAPSGQINLVSTFGNLVAGNNAFGGFVLPYTAHA